MVDIHNFLKHNMKLNYLVHRKTIMVLDYNQTTSKNIIFYLNRIKVYKGAIRLKSFAFKPNSNVKSLFDSKVLSEA